MESCLGYGPSTPKGAPHFGLKRSFQSLLLDGIWNPGQKFSILCPSRAGPSTRPTELAISARLHELPSLDSVTWRKVRRPIGCLLEKSRCLVPWNAIPDTLRHSHLSYVLVTRPSTYCRIQREPAEFFQFAIHSHQHIPTSP